MSIEVLHRTGWVMRCPFCHGSINYTLINIQDPPVPFFYGEDCSDVLLRKKDQKLVDMAFADSGRRNPSLKDLQNLWCQILEGAPLTTYGGRYGFWSNVKCPTCSAEIPYDDGMRNVERRIFEPKIVLLDGASLIGDTEAESWRINVIIEETR